MAEEAISTQGRRSSQARRKPARRSDVWVHFTAFTDDDGNDKARCKNCNQVLGASTRNGTSTLRAHVRICRGEEAAAAASSSRAAPAAQLLLREEPADDGHHGAALGEEEEASRDLARMIALGGHDPSVVEDEYFRSFVRRLNPGFKLPSREAIEKMCDDVFTESSENMARSWPDDGGRVSYAVGIAKHFEAGEVLHLTGHFVDDEWKLHRVVDDAYVRLPPASTHYNNEFTFLGVPVVSRGGEIERVLHHFCPEPHDPPIMVLGETTGDIGCLELKRRIEQELRSDDMEEREVMCSTYVDHVLHSVARCLLPDSGAEKKGLSIILDSAWPRQNRQELLSKLGLDDPWQYNEHWYWCYCSLKMFEYEASSSLIIGFQKPLCNVWGEIYGAMKTISDPGTPTSALCLRELLKVRGVLQSQLPKDTEGMSDYFVVEDTAIVGLKKALETLDKALEDSYLVWSLPLVLDPRYKLRHIEESFKKVFDDSKAANYTTEVRRMIKELYTRYTDGPDDSIDEMAIDGTNQLDHTLGEQCHPQNDDSRATTNKTELDHYLDDSLARTSNDSDFDILNWWNVHGSVQYPMVAQMARDALAMPTCSKLTPHQTAHVRSLLRGYYRLVI